MPSSENILPTAMFLLGMVMAISILFRRIIRSNRRRRKTQDNSPIVHVKKPITTRNLPLLDAPPDTLKWQVEMHELARDLKAEIDTKMRTLQQLMRAAQAEQERLEETIERARRVEAE